MVLVRESIDDTIRRCGKSKLLDAFIDYLSKTDDNNIRERNFDSLYQIRGLLQNLSWNDQVAAAPNGCFSLTINRRFFYGKGSRFFLMR